MQPDILETIRNYIEQEGFRLAFYEFTYGDNKVYRLFVENKDLTRANIAQIEKLHKYLRTILFVEGILDEKSRIEVGSPGLDRPLVSCEDYQRFAGEKVRLNLHEPVNGLKKISGTMSELNSEGFLVQTEEGMNFEIKFDNIQKANLIPVFENEKNKNNNKKKK